MSLAIFSLAPQEGSSADKPKIYSQLYKKLREEVGGRAKLGVLVQSSLGHGHAPIQKSFERIVSIQTLEEVPSKCCPLGENVKKYLKDACRQVALLKPDFVMIDDDFRMYCSNRLSGCLCPLHLKKISERLGREIGAKEAKARMNGTSPEDKRVAAVIDEVITGSMLDLARELRASMDEADPSIPCSIGTCDADIRYAKKNAEILAGKGNKPVVRINNARYAGNNTTPRTFAKSMYKTAA